MNSFGQLLRLTTFGESHGVAIGGVVDGFPAGVVIDEAFIRGEMQRRRPGQSAITTQRNEQDEIIDDTPLVGQISFDELLAEIRC